MHSLSHWSFFGTWTPFISSDVRKSERLSELLSESVEPPSARAGAGRANGIHRKAIWTRMLHQNSRGFVQIHTQSTAYFNKYTKWHVQTQSISQIKMYLKNNKQNQTNKQKLNRLKTWFVQPEVVYLTKHDLINNERTVLFTSNNKRIYLQIKLGQIRETLTCHSFALNSMKCFLLLKSSCWSVSPTTCGLSGMYNLEEIPRQTRIQQKVDPSKMTWECPPVQLEEEWGRCRPPCSFLWSIHLINICKACFSLIIYYSFSQCNRTCQTTTPQSLNAGCILVLHRATQIHTVVTGYSIFPPAISNQRSVGWQKASL